MTTYATNNPIGSMDPKDLFDNAEAEVSSHAKYGELNLDFAASVTSVPYHPGAAKYFAEKGYTVATK